MSRMITVATMMALILALAIATAAFAQENPTAAQPGAGQCVNFVDADNDGVCDNLGQNVPAQDGTGRQHGRSGGQRGLRR